MKNLFYFMLGLCLIILTSATTVSIMTVKPATPKSVVYFRFTNINQLKPYIQKGYIVKIISKGDEWDTGHVVMEKY